MDAHGGLIASAPEFGQVSRCLLDERQSAQGWAIGVVYVLRQLAGQWSVVIQRPDGVNMSALFNQRSDASGLKYEAIRDVLE